MDAGHVPSPSGVGGRRAGRIGAHVKTRFVSLIGLSACALALCAAGGCNESSVAWEESRALKATSVVAGGTRAPSSGEGAAPVFASAGVRRVLSAEDLAGLPEYARLDAGMNIASAGPILATDQWPQPQAPSLYDRRYLSLPSNPQNLMYIDPSAPRDPYWRYRYWR